jgi:hypothetical protein
MQYATPAIAYSVLADCNRHGALWFWLGIQREPPDPSGKAHRQRRLVLETLLIFLALLGSFALVGLLVRFSENVIRPVDEMAAADHRGNETHAA